MASLSTRNVSVGTVTPVALHEVHSNDVVLTVSVNSGYSDVAVGLDDVTTTTGFTVEAGGALTVSVPAGTVLYGIAATASNARVLEVRP